MRYLSLFFILCFYSLTLQAEEAKPHILYINADDMGVMDVGYNNSIFNTPNLDQLASEGMVFTAGYAPAANCAPSRACVHSGQWAARHGVYTVGSSERGNAIHRKIIPIKNTDHLSEDVVTIAKSLKAGGYNTIHLGKYHLGKDPLQEGYDVNVGGDHTGSPAGGYYSPWKNGSMKEWSSKVPPKTHRIDIYADEAVKFIKNRSEAPMFIHFSPYMVHTPLTAVPEFMENYKGKPINQVYASMVEKFDEAVGKVLKALKDEGLNEKTLVVFSSDNGGICKVNPQTPHRAGKGSYFEGGVREPFVVRWTGKVEAGTTCDTPVNTLDFYPTFLDVAKLEKQPQQILDGQSLVPLMNQQKGVGPRPMLWHFPIYLQAYAGVADDSRDALFRTRPGSALRYGNWKLHHYFEENSYELYDLNKDAGERKNVATAFPEKTEELKKLLNDWRIKTEAPIPSELNPKYDPNAKVVKKSKKKKAKK